MMYETHETRLSYMFADFHSLSDSDVQHTGFDSPLVRRM